MRNIRMHTDKNIQVFFELLRAGLWEKEARLAQYKDIDYAAIMRMAEEQSVVGLITAGLEQVKDVKVPQEWTLQFIGATLQIEQKNKAMNEFVAKLIELLRKNDVYTLLVKGQGIAQCYERPLWRASGDVDLLLSDTNYEKAKKVLIPLAQSVESEFETQKHLGMTIDGIVVELHGTLHSRLSTRVDQEIDVVQNECFFQGEVRSWQNGKTQVFLPSCNQDVIFVFTHILHHFFIEGVGLRQLCDWCRLMWVYRNSIDHKKLKKHLRSMGLMSEWKVFSDLAIEWLGMPTESIPLYYPSKQFLCRANKVMRFVLETGNFGHGRKNTSSKSFIIRKISSMWLHTKDSVRLSRIFPIDAMKVWWQLLVTGTIETIRGRG